MSDSTLPGDAAESTIVRHSVGANIVHMMSSQLVTWVIATLVAVIVPRFLGPSTLGDLRLAGSLWLIVGIITGLGTSQFLQLEIARDQPGGLVLIGPILIIRTLAFFVCALALWGYVVLIDAGHQFVMIVVLMGVATIFGQWADVYGTAFVGLEHMSTTAFAGAATKLLSFLTVLALLIAGAGVIGVVAVTAISGLAGLVYLVWRFSRVTKLTFDNWRPQARYAIRGSTTFMAAGVALVVYQQIDIIVISWVAESQDLGWYGAADTLVGSLLFPATVVIAAIFPTMGRLHETNEVELEALVRRTFSILILLAVPIGLGTTLIGPRLAPLLYGEAFREAGISLAILGPAIVLIFGTILFGMTALATERGLLWAGVIFASALVTVPLDIVLVPWAYNRYDNGAIGGAISYVVTEALQFGVGVAIIVPYLATRTVAWRITRILVAGGVMFAVGWPIRDLPFPVPVVVCALVYGLAVVVFRVLGDQERHAIGQLLAGLGLRNSWAG